MSSWPMTAAKAIATSSCGSRPPRRWPHDRAELTEAPEKPGLKAVDFARIFHVTDSTVRALGDRNARATRYVGPSWRSTLYGPGAIKCLLPAPVAKPWRVCDRRQKSARQLCVRATHPNRSSLFSARTSVGPRHRFRQRGVLGVKKRQPGRPKADSFGVTRSSKGTRAGQ